MNQVLQHQINRIHWDTHFRSQPMPMLVRRSVIAEADALHSAGNYTGAIRVLNESKNVEDDPYALNLRGLCRLGNKDYEGGLKDFGRTQQILMLRLSKAYQNQACTFVMMKKFGEALHTVLYAIDIFPAYPSPWVTWLSILGLTGKTESIPEVVKEMDLKWPSWRQDEEFRRYLKEDADLKSVRLHPLFKNTI